MFWTLLLELVEWSNTYRDSLPHQERYVLGYQANISRYLYYGIHNCFHPWMDWEQNGGEIQSKTSSIRGLRKAQALSFSENYSPKQLLQIFDTIFWLAVQKHLSLQLIVDRCSDCIYLYDHLVWHICETFKEFTYPTLVHKIATYFVYWLTQYTA